MVRTASFRAQQHPSSTYMHRSSVYSRRPGYVDISQVDQLLKAPEIKNDEADFVLPPKPPTPDVILRTDLMAKQRTTVAL